MEKIDKLIVKTIYERVDMACSLLLSGDTKKGMVLLKQILPKGYEHSFEKDKAA